MVIPFSSFYQLPNIHRVITLDAREAHACEKRKEKVSVRVGEERVFSKYCAIAEQRTSRSSLEVGRFRYTRHSFAECTFPQVINRKMFRFL